MEDIFEKVSDAECLLNDALDGLDEAEQTGDIPRIAAHLKLLINDLESISVAIERIIWQR